MATTPTSAAVSHVGKIRSNNQDSGYAGVHLFVVADGMGGHAGGDVASAIAAKRIAEADAAYPSVRDAEFALQQALIAANSILAETVFEHSELTGMGTTVSGILRVGNQLALAHIGDSRVYRLRDGELTQITADHTFVQRLVDSGRITPDQAASASPQRAFCSLVLLDVAADAVRSPTCPIRRGAARAIVVPAVHRRPVRGTSGEETMGDHRCTTVRSAQERRRPAGRVEHSTKVAAPTTSPSSIARRRGQPGCVGALRRRPVVGSAAVPLSFESDVRRDAASACRRLLLHLARGHRPPSDSDFGPAGGPRPSPHAASTDRGAGRKRRPPGVVASSAPPRRCWGRWWWSW